MLGLMRGTGMKTTAAPEGQIAPRSDFLNSSLNYVSPEYFETMRIPLLAGRNFRPDEPESKPHHVIVNRAFVRRFFPDVDPIGRKFGIGTEKIVPGELRNYRRGRRCEVPFFARGRPADHLQLRTIRIPKYVAGFILHVRTKNRPERIIQSVRRALNQIDPRLPFLRDPNAGGRSGCHAVGRTAAGVAVSGICRGRRCARDTRRLRDTGVCHRPKPAGNWHPRGSGRARRRCLAALLGSATCALPALVFWSEWPDSTRPRLPFEACFMKFPQPIQSP